MKHRALVLVATLSATIPATAPADAVAAVTTRSTFGARPHLQSWISPLAKTAKELLYVGSISGTIDIFAVTRGGYQLIGRIVDLNGPEGLHTDSQGSLYVADQGAPQERSGDGDIAVYPKGAKLPSTVIAAGFNVSDAVLGSDGDIYASNFSRDGHQFGPGSMSVFGPTGQRPLRTTVIPGSFQALGLVMDPTSSDVFVTYDTLKTGGHIVVFQGGTGKPIDLGVSYGTPWGITEDGSGNLLACDGNGEVHIYTQSGTLLRSFIVPGAPYRLAFNHDRSLLYITNFNNFDVEVFTYPATKMVASIHSPDWSKESWPDGVAVWPSP